jgi:chromatin segregation and condensation protein Rec8/ScpA/Scc1 (kleisin family)
MISLPIKRKPRIKISIEDLKKALKEALKIELKREERWEKRKEVEYGINLNRADIKKRLEEFFKALLSRFSRKSKIRFEEVLERKDREEKVEKFSNILFLESDKKINCIQKQFLGELLIEIEKSAKAE